MENIILKPLFHRNSECIGIYFGKNISLEKIIRKQPGVKWSQTNKCWHIPLTETAYHLLVKDLKEKAIVNTVELKAYLEKKNKVQASLAEEKQFAGESRIISARPVTITPAWQLSATNLKALEIFVQKLQLKAYSSSTINTYRNEFMQLLKLLKKKSVDELTPDDLKRYMVYAMEKEGIKENTAHSRLNALKFYFEQVLGREKFFWEIPRPKKQQQLPKLLNETEIRKLFNALTNKKHKAMLFTAYSAGLRVSEIAALKIADIDSGRMQILIAQGKGKKDRYVNLSPVLLDILRTYISSYKPKPVYYLFESKETGQAYPVRTIQQIFSNAKNKAGLKKEVGIHSLRHSFATHLLDKGTDIKYIKDLLGHFSIKTTERYLHVSKQQLVNIISPFDDLWASEKPDW
jgi:site-specific recombinase XerD